MIGELLEAVPAEFAVALATFFLLVLLRLLLRKDWAAAAVFVLIFAAMSALSGQYPLVDFTEAAVAFGVVMLVLRRYGFFCLLVLFTTDDIMYSFVNSIQLSRWYAAPTILGVLFVLALAVYGFRVSLAGRPVFSGAALDE